MGDGPIGLPPEFGGGGVGGPPSDPGVFIQIEAIWQAINLLGTLILLLANSILQAVVNAFRAVLKFLSHIWKNYIKKAITWLASEIQKFRDWLKRTLQPIITRLQKIKKWYDEHILKQQLRLLQMIQTIRRYLAILRIFGVKWASALDSALADIQTRIEQSIAIIRGTLNQIINTLALVLDPALLIFRNVLGASMITNVGAIKRIVDFGGGRPLFASEQDAIAHDHSLYFASTVKSTVQQRASTGLNDDDKAKRDAVRCALKDATNTPLPF